MAEPPILTSQEEASVDTLGFSGSRASWLIEPRKPNKSTERESTNIVQFFQLFLTRKIEKKLINQANVLEKKGKWI